MPFAVGSQLEKRDSRATPTTAITPAMMKPKPMLFTAPGGGYLRATNFRRRVWKPAVLKSVGEPMRFHDLRHTHVALLIEQGVHPAVVAARLGHTSVRTVLDVYGHLYEGLDRDAADALTSPWNGSGVVATWSRPSPSSLATGL